MADTGNGQGSPMQELDCADFAITLAAKGNSLISNHQCDPTLIETAGRVDAFRRALEITPPYADRLWNDLLEFDAPLSGQPLNRSSFSSVGLPASPAYYPAVLLPEWRTRPVRWVSRHLATAALLVVTLAAVLVFVGGYRLPVSSPGWVPAGLVKQLPVDPESPDAGLYRGDPARTGIAPGPAPAGQPVERWRAQFGIAAWSSPVVADGVVFSTAEQGLLVALDAATGVELWHFETDGFVEFSPGPAVANGVVYMGMGDGVFYALDARNGAVRWTHEEGVASCASPVVVDGIVFGATGCTDAGAIFALDATTGALVWRVENDAGKIPALAVADGVLYAAAAGARSAAGFSTGLLALDAATGDERWRFETGDGITSGPAVANGTVYVASLAGLFAVDTERGELRWAHRKEEGYGSMWSTPGVAHGIVYAAFDRGTLYAFDGVTGAEQWQAEVLTVPENVADPTIVDGVVYVSGNHQGVLFAIDAQTGQELWQVKLRGQNSSAPTIVDGVIYIGFYRTVVGGVIALADVVVTPTP